MTLLSGHFEVAIFFDYSHNTRFGSKITNFVLKGFERISGKQNILARGLTNTWELGRVENSEFGRVVPRTYIM